ncbi:MAG: acyl-CoA dehydrogenase family protein [Deltaproteobacteria bacterium]|nr:acyl-CoA dehydrogenase family protein [Deltaproteobacteria bacterium]MBP7289093.1 acyl-CoA dehydrogenase family protein [Nannocystaceae bacterium]
MSAIAAVAGVARSDTLEALLGAVRSFTAREVDPRAASWDAAEALAPGLAAQAAELGLLGVSAPEADGGLGAGLFGAAWVIEAVAASSGTLAVLLALHEAAAVGLALALPGAQARGAAMAAATTGLSQLSGWIGPQHGLVHAQVGDALALRGRVGMAVAASAPLVLASRGAQGDALHRAVPGAAAQPRAAHGLRGAGWARLELDLPLAPEATWLVGDAASAAIVRIQARVATLVAAVGCGLARAAVSQAAAYAKQREQFGAPIASFQAIQWKLADGMTRRDAAWLLTLAAADACDRGSSSAMAAAARAQLAAHRAAATASSDALQIHGGYGYTCEFPIERMYRDARALPSVDADEVALREAIGTAIAQRFA